MNRYRFLEIFQENSDGSLAPQRIINVNGVILNQGVAFRPGVVFGGIDFHQYKYSDIAGEEQNGILIIKGFYKQ